METKKDQEQASNNKEVLENNATAVNKQKEKNANEKVAEAHEQADADIADDRDLIIESPNSDLDEGELARLGEDPIGIL
jgi:hypothetical protein